jgi:hypothetical protein
MDSVPLFVIGQATLRIFPGLAEQALAHRVGNETERGLSPRRCIGPTSSINGGLVRLCVGRSSEHYGQNDWVNLLLEGPRR